MQYLDISLSQIFFHRQTSDYTTLHLEYYKLYKNGVLQQAIMKNLPAKYSKLIKDYISKVHVLEDLIVQK